MRGTALTNEMSIKSFKNLKQTACLPYMIKWKGGL